MVTKYTAALLGALLAVLAVVAPAHAQGDLDDVYNESEAIMTDLGARIIVLVVAGAVVGCLIVSAWRVYAKSKQAVGKV